MFNINTIDLTRPQLNVPDSLLYLEFNREANFPNCPVERLVGTLKVY